MSFVQRAGGSALVAGVLLFGAASSCQYDWSLEPPADASTADASADAFASGGDAAPVVEAGTSSAYAAAVRADGPRFYWRFGEASGTNAFDQIAGKSDAVYGGAFTLGVPGAIAEDGDTAVFLDGNTGCITAGSIADYAGTAAFTYEGWYKPSVAIEGYWRLTNRQSADDMSSVSTVVSPDGGNLIERFVGGTQRAVGTKAVPGAGSWAYFAATYDGTELVMTTGVNGVVTSGSNGDGRSIPSYLGTLEMGCRSGVPSTFVQGALDEFAIYDRALTPAQIAHHYAVGIGVDGG